MGKSNGTTLGRNIDSSKNLQDIVDSHTHFQPQPITDTDSLEEFLPQYDGQAAFQPATVGMQGTEPSECDWVHPPYHVDSVSAVARIISTVTNCMLVHTDPENTLECPRICTTGFDGVIVGTLESFTDTHGQVEFTLSAVHNLQLLYAKALLTIRYERETTDRIMSDAPESAVEATERKMNSMRKTIRQSLSKTGRNVVTSVDSDGQQRVAVECLEGTHSQLCD